MMEWDEKNEHCCWMEPDGNKSIGTIGKLIELPFFGHKNLQTIVAKLEHRNFLKTNALQWNLDLSNIKISKNPGLSKLFFRNFILLFSKFTSK